MFLKVYLLLAGIYVGLLFVNFRERSMMVERLMYGVVALSYMHYL